MWNPLREKEIKWCAKKLLGIRLFEEGDKHWKKNVKDEDLELLVVSQFTLYSGKKTLESKVYTVRLGRSLAKKGLSDLA